MSNDQIQTGQTNVQQKTQQDLAKTINRGTSPIQTTSKLQHKTNIGNSTTHVDNTEMTDINISPL